MKKLISLGLVGVMALAMIPTALATTDYTNGTLVKYVGTGDAEYTITVPALLAPGGEGDVTLKGTWASDTVLKVSADKTVTLTNSINPADKKTLDVTFAGISQVGDNTKQVQAVEAVSVSDISNAIFGTWSGKFNYNVEVGTAVEMIGFTIGATECQAEKGMTWGEWVESDYNIVNAGSVKDGDKDVMTLIIAASGDKVYLTDLIVEGESYVETAGPII